MRIPLRGLDVALESDCRADGDRVVTFCKRTQASMDKIDHSLEGGIVRE